MAVPIQTDKTSIKQNDKMPPFPLEAGGNHRKITGITFHIFKTAALTAVIGGSVACTAYGINAISSQETIGKKIHVGMACFVFLESSRRLIKVIYNLNQNNQRIV